MEQWAKEKILSVYRDAADTAKMLIDTYANRGNSRHSVTMTPFRLDNNFVVQGTWIAKLQLNKVEERTLLAEQGQKLELWFNGLERPIKATTVGKYEAGFDVIAIFDHWDVLPCQPDTPTLLSKVVPAVDSGATEHMLSGIRRMANYVQPTQGDRSRHWGFDTQPNTMHWHIQGSEGPR